MYMVALETLLAVLKTETTVIEAALLWKHTQPLGPSTLTALIVVRKGYLSHTHDILVVLKKKKEAFYS